MKHWITQAACAAATVIVSTSAQASLVSNGDFETGTLAGWSTFVTPNGNLPLSTVTSFDVTGAGSSQAATFRAGSSGFGVNGGGGLSQQFSTSGGAVSFSADVAAFRNLTSAGSNLFGGLFELVVDDVVLDSVDFGSIVTGAERDALTATTVLSAGVHELRLRLTRFAAPAPDVFGYFDNVVVTEAGTVPEPGSLALVLLAIAGAAAAGRGKLR